MWNDLMRRWMDLALWWVPGRKNGQPESERSQAAAGTPPSQPSAAPTAPTAPSAQARPENGEKTLTGIKGIGPAMEKRLNALGIISPADLAAANPATLTEQLKAGKAVVSEEKVKAWIEAAAGRS